MRSSAISPTKEQLTCRGFVPLTSLQSRDQTIEELGTNPVIIGIMPEMLSFFYRDEILILYDDVLTENIYDASNLATLKGSKYHKKRNQFNQYQKSTTTFSLTIMDKPGMRSCTSWKGNTAKVAQWMTSKFS